MTEQQTGGETRRPSRSGEDWLGDFLRAQAEVEFHMLWLVFGFGQAGVAMKEASPDVARAMVEKLSADADDFATAAVKLDAVTRDMIANAKRNIEEARP